MDAEWINPKIIITRLDNGYTEIYIEKRDDSSAHKTFIFSPGVIAKLKMEAIRAKEDYERKQSHPN